MQRHQPIGRVDFFLGIYPCATLPSVGAYALQLVESKMLNGSISNISR
jgi:hypothetical protein